MALFGKKEEAKEKKAKAAPKPKVVDQDVTGVLVSPRLTEKSVALGEQNVYTFEVRKDANKHQVRAAVKALYNVTPVKVNIVNKKAAKRTKGFSGKTVHYKGMKKAYVYLKKGDTINIV